MDPALSARACQSANRTSRESRQSERMSTAQIIHESRSRVKVFRKELNHSADRDASLGFLKETYARVLQGVDSQAAEDESNSEVDTKEPLKSMNSLN